MRFGISGVYGCEFWFKGGDPVFKGLEAGLRLTGAGEAEHHRNRERLTRSLEVFKIGRGQSSCGWNLRAMIVTNKYSYSGEQPGVSLSLSRPKSQVVTVII